MKKCSNPEIKRVLDKLAADKTSDFVKNDPVSFCHRYNKAEDIEIAALIASSFAYGNIKIILKDLEIIFARIGSSPTDFISNLNIKDELLYFKNFKHRFNDGRDLTALFLGIKEIKMRAATIEDFFSNSIEKLSVTEKISRFSRNILAFDYSEIFGKEALSKSFAFLFPSPDSKSACKRLCMFLRWLVRASDGVDLGVWKSVSPADILIPVDTHICRIAQLLNLTSRKNGDWKMTLEITESLKKFDPSDPVKYDFALAHIGISGNCDGKNREICKLCKIKSVCSSYLNIL